MAPTQSFEVWKSFGLYSPVSVAAQHSCFIQHVNLSICSKVCRLLISFSLSLAVILSDLPRPDQIIRGIWSCRISCGHCADAPSVPHSLPPPHFEPIPISITLLLREPPSDTPPVPRCPALPKRTCRFIREQKIFRFVSFIINVVIAQSHAPISVRANQPGLAPSPRLHICNRKCFRVIPDETADLTGAFPCGKNRDGTVWCLRQCYYNAFYLIRMAKCLLQLVILLIIMT